MVETWEDVDFNRTMERGFEDIVGGIMRIWVAKCGDPFLSLPFNFFANDDLTLETLQMYRSTLNRIDPKNFFFGHVNRITENRGSISMA